MTEKKNLLGIIGILVLLLSLAAPMIQCAPGEVTEEEGVVEEEGAVEEEGEEAEIPEKPAKPVRLSTGWPTTQMIDTLTCDETWQYMNMGSIFWQLLYDQLCIMGPAPDYEPLPMLATSWESTDGRTWTYHLREDAVFHDGIPVTAEDVAFTIENLPKSNPTFSFADITLEPGTSVKIIDDYTLEFTLETVHGGRFPAPWWVPVLPKHIWEPYKDNLTSYPNDEAIGSGPFKLKEFKPGQYIWFEANEDYAWGDIPHVDEVVFQAYGSDDAMYMALKNGEIDMIGYGGCSPLVVDDFKGVENIEVIISQSELEWELTFNLHKDGPLQDLDVRKAVMYGIDRDSIIALAYNGYAEKIDSFLYPEMEEHNPDLPQYDYDAGKAGEILEQAGYLDTNGDGIRNNPATGKNLAFELIVSSDYTSEVKAITMIKEQLRNIGIEISMTALDEATYESLLYAPTNDLWDIAMGWATPGPNGDWVWEYARSYEGGGEWWNSAYYNNPEYDALLDELLIERDMTKRKEWLYDMQMVLAEDLPYGYLWRVMTIDPVRTDKLEGYVATMGGVANWFNPWSYFELRPK